MSYKKKRTICLNFSNQPIIFNNIEDIEDIDEIDLRYNSISIIPDIISQMKNVYYLDLSHNDINILPPAICKLTLLQTLILNHNNIAILPNNTISNLTQLHILDISFNKLIKLPDDIYKLKFLYYLNLTNNKITHLNNICKTDYIYIDNIVTNIDLSNTNICSIPEWVYSQTNLIELIIDNNMITTLSECYINRLAKLEILSASNNMLSEIPVHNNIKYLYLDSNKIKCITDNIANLYNICILQLSNNIIEGNIDIITCLPTLQILYLDNNKITNIPNKIDNMINMKELYLHNNNIINLPQSLILKSILKSYDMVEQISYIDKSIYNNTEIVHDNNITNSINTSIHNIMNQKLDINPTMIEYEIENNTILTCQSIIAEYMKYDVEHSIYKVTFKTLMYNVWNTIKLLNNDNILIILNTEMHLSKDTCLTGICSRLISCMDGFTSLVNIKLDDNNIISNIIICIKNKLGKLYNVEEHKRLVRIALIDLQYSNDIINLWVEYIS